MSIVDQISHTERDAAFADLAAAIGFVGEFIGELEGRGTAEEIIAPLRSAKTSGEQLAAMPDASEDDVEAYLSLALERVDAARDIADEDAAQQSLAHLS
jgi:hypothetical protein